MKNFKIFSFLFFVSCFLFSCSDSEESLKSDLNPLNDKIMGVPVRLSNYTHGNKPSSIVYSATHHKALIEEGMDDIEKQLELSHSTEHDKWLVLFSKKEALASPFNVEKKDVIGLGFCYLNENKYIFDLFQNNAGRLKRVKSVEFGNSFPMRILDHFIPYLGMENKTNSIVFIANSDIGKTVQVNPSGLYKDLMDKFKLLHSQEIVQTSVEFRDDCGCDVISPCCPDDGCGWDEIKNTYCGWDENSLWVCKSCETSVNCQEKRGFETGAFCSGSGVQIDEQDFTEKSYSIRDGFLKESLKGQDYISMYYQVGTLVDIDELFSLHTCIENAGFAIKTLDVSTTLKDGRSDEIVVTDDYYDMAISFLDKYADHFTNEEFLRITNKIKFDLNKYKGWTKEAVLADIE
ncbi:MAG TPA: hypothetical protein ENJ28_10940 [Gammaproteobacteria bacterium]|nr:hypothetical protein [Gammaproteobacteria bacterium]